MRKKTQTVYKSQLEYNQVYHQVFDKPARVMLCIPSPSDHSPGSSLNSPVFISIPELQRAEKVLNFKIVCCFQTTRQNILFSLVN